MTPHRGTELPLIAHRGAWPLCSRADGAEPTHREQEDVVDLDYMASRLSAALALNNQPVALTFVEAPPAGIPAIDQVVPSACTFWRLAENRTFYAPANAHFNCPVGSMVMGFDMPNDVRDQLNELMNKMCGCNYIEPAEAEYIPTHSGNHTGIVYGPLAKHPTTPTVVLLWLTPRQAMLCNEAGGSARWSADASPRTTGRPACAVLPLSVSGDTPITSFGCTGMRTFTEISDDRMLIAIPGNRLSDFADAAEATATSNKAMSEFYQSQKAAVAQGANA